MSKKGAAVGTLLGTVAAASVAYAVAGGWTSPQGSGSGSATAWTAVASVPSNSTTAPGDVLGTALYPGGPAVTGVVSVTNPNPYPVQVTSISNDGGNAASGACAANTVRAVTASGTPLTQHGGATTAIPAGGSGLYDITYTMESTADNACQGKTFAVALHVDASSANF